MEFLVEIEVKWPPEGDPALRDRMIAEERVRAAEFGAKGMIRRMWRIPGRWANVALWEVRDATELHQALASLPFYPWLDITVRPLAVHPSDPERGAGPPP
jgi:muconolactone D-isomerase